MEDLQNKKKFHHHQRVVSATIRTGGSGSTRSVLENYNEIDKTTFKKDI